MKKLVFVLVLATGFAFASSASIQNQVKQPEKTTQAPAKPVDKKEVKKTKKVTPKKTEQKQVPGTEKKSK